MLASLHREPVSAAAPAAPVSAPAAAFLAFGLAAAFAMATGLAESVLLAFARLRLHHLVHLPQQIVWIAPVAYGVVFALPAALALLAARRRPDGNWLGWLVALLTFLAAYSLLQLEVGIWEVARILLAAGLALRAGTFARARQRLLRRLLPPVLAGLSLALALLTGGVYGLRFLHERRALAALPGAAGGQPNVLLLIWDTVRASDLGLYGFDRPTTPNLDSFAAAGATFDQAVSTAPWTLPSHASMFTGRYPEELAVGWRRPLDGRYPTLAERLARHGYATAGFVGNTIYTGYEFGLDRGFAHYEDYRVSPGEFVLALAFLRPLQQWRPALLGNDETLARKDAAEVNGEFLRWLDRRPAGRPFFAFLNHFDAHEPYLPRAPYDSIFRSIRVQRKPLMMMSYKATPGQVRAEHDAYDACIAYLDAQLGSLLGALRQRGLLDNTIVVIAADHGEEFGEHGVFTHGNSLYLPSLHVPLVVVDPRRVPAGVRVDARVSLRDLPATILDLVGVPRAGFPGASLARFWHGPAPAVGTTTEPLLAEVPHATGLPASYPVSVGDMHSVFAGGFQLIVDGDRRQELYDLRTDPMERHDLLAPPRTVGAPAAGSAPVATRTTANSGS